MTRWKAAAIHVLISLFIGIVVAILILGLWYPPPYFIAAGADELMLLLLGVDLTLGPLLTLTVYRTGKRGLRYDLAVIGTLQIAAMVYGLSVIVDSRPVFLVAVVDRFALVSANEITDADLAMGREPQFRSRSWTGPRLVAVEMPTDSAERMDLALSAGAGRDAQNVPKYYRDYADEKQKILAKAKSVEDLRRRHREDSAVIDDAFRNLDRSEESAVWLPIQGRKSDLVMLLDRETGQPVGTLPVDPW